MASKTPVGHVMTWFESVCNITPHLKVIIPDRPNFSRTGFRVLIDTCFETSYGSIYSSWDQVIELMVSKNGVLIVLLGGSIWSLVVMFFSLSNFYHMHCGISLGVDEPHVLDVEKQIILILVHFSLSFNFFVELW